jgi:DNA replication protein DnaC
MNNDANLQQLNELRLWGMASSYDALLQLPVHELPTGHQMLAQLLQAESLHRKQQRNLLLVRNARFRYLAAIEELNFASKRNLIKDQILALTDCGYIDRSENILITGSTGCGKRFLASALGYQACLMGYRVRYFNMNKLVETLYQSRADSSIGRELLRIEKHQLLILDDFGLQPMDQDVKMALLQIMEDRHGRGATIITSQLPVGKWYDFINEPTLADAIMDRLLAKEHRIDLKGESLRRTKGEEKPNFVK